MKTEEKIQQECFVWFWNTHCLKCHNPREIIYHVPNEGANNGRLVKIGLLRGCADLICTFKGITLYVEVKSSTGSLRASQKAFRTHIECMGDNHAYFVVRSLEEFKNIISQLHEKKEI